MESRNFFKYIPSFKDFSGFCDEKNYYPAPSEWVVVATDVVNSTDAINNGRYRDVNIAGASAIAATKNVCKDMDIPFVFGGDGATILIPDEVQDSVKKELIKTKALCKKSLNLDLRIGIIPLKEIENNGANFQVAKYQLSDGIYLAMFGGGGVRVAENLLKKSDKYLINESFEGDPDLEGLSCRWQPLKSKNGKILTLLVLSKVGETGIYKEIAKKLIIFWVRTMILQGLFLNQT